MGHFKGKLLLDEKRGQRGGAADFPWCHRLASKEKLENNNETGAHRIQVQCCHVEITSLWDCRQSR